MKTLFLSLALCAFTYVTSLAQLANPTANYFGDNQVGSSNFQFNAGSDASNGVGALDFLSDGEQFPNSVRIDAGGYAGILIGTGTITGTTIKDTDNDTLKVGVAILAQNQASVDGEITVEFGYGEEIQFQQAVSLPASSSSATYELSATDSISFREFTAPDTVFYRNTGTEPIYITNLYFRISSEVVTDIDESLADVQYKMYPNPTTDFLQLDMGGFENEAAYVSLINTNGEEVLRQNYNNSLDVQDVPKGIYLLSVLNEENETIGTPKKVVLY